MTVFGAADLDPLLADTGVTVTYSSVSVNGLLDQAQVLQTDPNGYQVSIDRQSVLVKTGALTGLAVNAAIVVDGVTYKIRDVSLEGDGAYTRVVLAGP